MCFRNSSDMGLVSELYKMNFYYRFRNTTELNYIVRFYYNKR